jgi:small-conductance mechanosensitive channel
LDKVESIAIEAAREVMNEIPGGVPGYEPLVRFNSFADFGIKFNIIMRAAEFNSQFVLVHELIKKLQVRYKNEGIELYRKYNNSIITKW